MPSPFVAATLVSKLSRYKIRKMIRLAVNFCALRLGKMRNRAYPTTYLSFYKNSDVMGEYDPYRHWIWIYPERCLTVFSLLRTLIHEWVHSVQKIRTEYQKLFLQYGYDDHPQEKEATAAEYKWGRWLLRYVQIHWKKSSGVEKKSHPRKKNG
jgi:hypothetical protein